MPVVRCEGCPVVGIERKCFALGKLAETARKEFADDGKTAKTYEVECPDLYMLPDAQHRNASVTGTMDDLREVDWEAEVVRKVSHFNYHRRGADTGSPYSGLAGAGGFRNG